MKNKKIAIILFLGIFVSSCATYLLSSSKTSTYTMYKNDLVSVATALRLAKNSYMLACVKASKRFRKNSHHLSKCSTEAQKYVKDTVQFILEQ